MVADHEDHGNTPAAWTAATIVMIAFVLGAVAVWTMNWPLFLRMRLRTSATAIRKCWPQTTP